MKIDVMTSFSKEYYDKLGKYSVKTFLKYWPEDINMLAYVEGCRLEDHPRIKQIPLTSLDKEYHDFQDNSKYKSRTKTFAKKQFLFFIWIYPYFPCLQWYIFFVRDV